MGRRRKFKLGRVDPVRHDAAFFDRNPPLEALFQTVPAAAENQIQAGQASGDDHLVDRPGIRQIQSMNARRNPRTGEVF
jgi:hypothetical protein